MLSVNLIEKTSDLLHLPIVANKKHLLICPSPAIADEMRQLIGQNPTHLRPQVLTISKFVQDLLITSGLALKVKRKSELMLPLATIWKKYDEKVSYETFQQAFTLFTELRSFTTDKDLLDEVFSRLDTRLNFALQIFWAYLDAEKLCDEHQAYASLSQWLKEEDAEGVRDFDGVSFFGFSHLNANQIDFIKSLSKRSEVCLPFYREAFEQSMNWDFIRWLTTEEAVFGTKATVVTKLNLVNFPQGRLNEALVVYFKKSTGGQEIDITLLTKDVSLKEIGEIPLSNIYFKSPADIFEEQVKFISHFTTDFLGHSDEDVRVQTLRDEVQKIITDEMKADFEKKDFRRIRMLQKFEELLEQYSELSEMNEFVSLFDKKVLIDILSLDTPRVYSVPLNKDGHTTQVRGLESIGSLNPKKKNVLIFSSQYSSLKSTSSLFDPDTLAILSQFGPVKRKELDFLILKKKIKEALELPEVTLFLEAGLEKTDPAWDELLREYEIIPSDLKVQAKQTVKDYFKPAVNIIEKKDFTKHISATKLQSFSDCPRKFYYSYIENLSSREEISTELRADELGSVQHKIIESYAKKIQAFDEEKHREVSQQILDKHITTQKRQIPYISYQKYLTEVINFSRNGLNFIYRLKEKYPEIEFSFEKDLSVDPDAFRKGSIDLYFKTDEGVGIIDFKRSGGSIPNQKKLIAFDKIQLWFYLLSLELDINDLMMMGFLNLSDPADSLVICRDNEMKLEVSEMGPKTVFFKELSKNYADYIEYEKQLILRLKLECDFLPQPKTPDVCTYCEIKNVCSRGNHVG